ncbi:MAG: YceI family protein [Gammaproteobacteria bacterium]|nr:YceI family protein [Pseudomonadales bacterium]MCP5347969.1 YceI family protein [Pseudomonadales bacterium]
MIDKLKTSRHLGPCLCLISVLIMFSAGVGADTYELSNQNSPGSFFLVATDTAGLLGFVGHRHAILANQWAAVLELNLQDLSASRINVTVQTGSWTLDSERAYQLAGIDKAIPPQKDRVATMQRILGPEVLNVEKNPEIVFRSESVDELSLDDNGSSRLILSGGLQLRSDLLPPAPVEVAVIMERRPDKLVFTGSTEVLQSEFGINPFSLAGVVKVADRIRLVWRLEIDTSDFSDSGLSDTGL